MKLKIRHKLFLTLLLTSTMVAGGLFFMLQWSFDRGFLNYVNNQESAKLDQLAAQLASYYAKQGGWEFIVENHPLWRSMHDATLTNDPPGGRPRPIERIEHGAEFMQPPMGREKPPIGRDNIGPRVTLYDASERMIIGGGPDDSRGNIALKPIKYQDKIIGYLSLNPATELSHSGDLRFVEQQTETFGLLALLMVGISMLFTFPVTNHLLRPIKELTQGARKLISGKFQTRIPVSTGDELGHLSEHFNILAVTLERNEKARQQWVADISHELRTPLAILRGEVEALQDGVRKPGPQTFDPLHSEIMHLEHLVNDLYELSMSDIGALTYKRIEVNPVGILEGTLELFENRFEDRGIILNTTLPRNFPHSLLGDPDRLQQLFTNILENSLRYTDAPGKLEVSIEHDKERIVILFQDSGPGVETEQLPKLFDRLFRADISRNRIRGGAGLGLAICSNIVDAHLGTITASKSRHGGVEVRITLPLAA